MYKDEEIKTISSREFFERTKKKVMDMFNNGEHHTAVKFLDLKMIHYNRDAMQRKSEIEYNEELMDFTHRYCVWAVILQLKSREFIAEFLEKLDYDNLSNIKL